MERTDPFSSSSYQCPYCGAKVVHSGNYCPSCRRTLLDPPVKSSQQPLQPCYEEWRKPLVSALLSLIGLGLGQFYNSETIKGLAFFSLVVIVPYVLRIYTSLNPLVFILIIWGVAIADAYISAKKINQLKKPFRKKSIFFWPEISVLIILVAAVTITAVFPYGAAHSASLMAGALAESKYPGLSLPLYDTALIYAPNDTGILMNKVGVLRTMGKTDEARGDLDRIMVLKPNETAPVIMTGNLLYENGQYQESLRYFEKALLINPNDAHIWVRKGDAHLAISIIEMQKIRGKYRSLTSDSLSHPANSDASQLDAYNSTESQREAYKAYTQAIKLNPLLYVEISGRILASTQALITTYQGILEDLGIDNTTYNQR